MNSLVKKPFNVLDKAKSESMSDKEFERFNRVEKRAAAIGKAKISAFMSKYRQDIGSLSYLARAKEKHSSKRLGDFLRADGHPRPAAKWEAHHIVSGSHPDAMMSRLILADDDIRVGIDDPDNGCWMPKTKADARPTIYPNAIGHNRIHRDLYYQWIQGAITV